MRLLSRLQQSALAIVIYGAAAASVFHSNKSLAADADFQRHHATNVGHKHRAIYRERYRVELMPPCFESFWAPRFYGAPRLGCTPQTYVDLPYGPIWTDLALRRRKSEPFP